MGTPLALGSHSMGPLPSAGKGRQAGTPLALHCPCLMVGEEEQLPLVASPSEWGAGVPGPQVLAAPHFPESFGSVPHQGPSPVTEVDVLCSRSPLGLPPTPPALPTSVVTLESEPPGPGSRGLTVLDDTSTWGGSSRALVTGWDGSGHPLLCPCHLPEGGG